MEPKIVSYTLTVNWKGITGDTKSASMNGHVEMGDVEYLDYNNLMSASAEMQTVAVKLFDALIQGNVEFDCVDATLIETNMKMNGFNDFDAFKSDMMVKHNYCFDVHMDR